MKLCIVTHTVMKGDGQGRVNYEVAWEAIRRGHHVTLLASSVDLALQQHSQVDWISILNADWEHKAFDRAKVVVAISEKVAQELMAIGVILFVNSNN